MGPLVVQDITWQLKDVWQAIHEALRSPVRHALGRRSSPSAAIPDSQSVPTTDKGSPGAATRASGSGAANGIS